MFAPAVRSSRWFLENGLLLNPTKTKAVLFGTRAQREKMPIACGLNITGAVVPFHDTVKLLGVTLDSCNYHMSALRHIRHLLTHDAAKMIAHSVVSSRLYYAIALLYGTTTTNRNKLQVAQNTLVMVVCQAPRSVSATEFRRQLHWLPIRQRITYKIAVITYKTTLQK